jgi:beta-galactosidase GanA
VAASRAGAELYHPALVPHAGPDTRIFREAVALGETLERIGEVAGSTVTADAAVLVDAASRWALESRSLPSPHVRHLNAARAAHAALGRSGIGCDVVPPDADLAGYRLVVVPAVYLLSDQAAASLGGYVAGGGHLVVTFCSGVADQWHRVRTGGYPGALRDVLGVRVEEFHPLAPGTSATLTVTGPEPGVTVGRRRDGRDRSWWFAINYGSDPVTLPARGLDLITGRQLAGAVDLPPGGTAVIREEPPAQLGSGHPGTVIRIPLPHPAGHSSWPRVTAWMWLFGSGRAGARDVRCPRCSCCAWCVSGPWGPAVATRDGQDRQIIIPQGLLVARFVRFSSMINLLRTFTPV